MKNFHASDATSTANKFVESFEKSVEDITHTCSIKTLSKNDSILEKTIYMEDVEVVEIVNILKSISINKSAGADEIRPKEIRESAEEIAPVIAKLINMSMNEAVIPRKLKESLVRPIYKTGNR